ncbi:mapkkk cascade protein kinase regulator ste50 [Diplodia corticola]|uniref:Mapkkk cascade protein kinase regulator ste50 n=1 Tax=Diplodia corticola TaxID=236234 RepID=A0A1J9QN14_9PEZI|nr:mapkkk cascade protein kinase regulator ste50 [Diplodia corticola]OJD30278.1 mapkkk cascade protein kinase regulator ste50 [Diplodia corticola]
MADPLSIAGSIIGVAAAGVKVSLMLYQFADEVGSAAKDAKHIGREISNFCFILRILGTTLKEADAASVMHCRDVAEEMNERCLTMFIEIIELVRDLQRFVGGPGENSFKWTAKIKWALQKPRITYLRASLDTYKTTLNLMLETLSLADRVAKRRMRRSSVVDKDNDMHQQSLIQSLEQAHRASIAELQELEEQTLVDGEEQYLDAPEDDASNHEVLRDSYVSTASAERFSMIESVREDLESLRVNRTSTFSFEVLSTRNSLWLSEEQNNLRRWSSNLLDPSNEPSNRRNSRRSLDPRRSRRTTQMFDGVLQASPPPTIEETENNLEDAESASIINNFKDWLATLSSEDRYKAWSSILPVILRSPPPSDQDDWPSGFETEASDSKPALQISRPAIPACLPAKQALPLPLESKMPPTPPLGPSKRPDESPGETPEEEPSKRLEESLGETPEETLSKRPEESPRETPEKAPPKGPEQSPGGTPEDAPTEQSSDVQDGEPFKTFRVSIDDPTYAVLPVALKRWNITEDWRLYALYIVYEDQERCLGLNEKPLAMFKNLVREGRCPMFMLRKHVAPVHGFSITKEAPGLEDTGRTYPQTLAPWNVF